jgi:hypothetical protein
MKMNWHYLVASMAVGALASACGAAGDEGESNEGPPSVALSDRLAYMQMHGSVRALDAESPRNKGNKHTIFTAASGQVNTGKSFAAGNTCMLSGVWGNFSNSSNASSVMVHPYATGEWYLFADTGAAGSAICTEPGVFRAPPSSIEMLSNLGHASRATDGTSTTSMWWGDAITFLSEVTGEFEGDGESVHVSQSANVTTPSRLNARTGAETYFAMTYISVLGRSWFIGNPSNQWLVKLYGFTNGAWVRGNVSNAGTWQFTVGESGGFSSYWLAPFDSAVCYLTRVGGDLNSSSDKVNITTKESNFYLAATANAIGAARCFAYDQR